MKRNTAKVKLQSKQKMKKNYPMKMEDFHVKIAIKYSALKQILEDMRNYPAKVNLSIKYLQLAMEDLPAEIIVIKHSVVIKTMFKDMKRNPAKRELTNRQSGPAIKIEPQDQIEDHFEDQIADQTEDQTDG